MVGRSAWETIWAVLEGYYGFGFVNGDRLNPAETNFAIYPPVLPWGIITLAFGVLYIFFFLMRADFKRPRHVTAFTGLTVVFFLLYSKGYSPQFLVYLLPFVLLLLPNLAGVTYALILTLLNVLEQPVYFVFFPPDQFPAMHWLLTVIVTARFVVWLALLIECLMLLDVWHAPVLRQGMRWLLAGSTIIGLLLLTPNLVGAYGQAQLTRSPYRSVINFLRTQATTPPAALLMTDQPLYTRLYPYLRFDYDLKLAGGEATFPTAPTTAQLLEGESLAWLLTGSDQGAVIVETMNGLAQPLSLYRFEDSEANLLLLYDVAGLSAPPTPLAVADTGIELLSYELDSSSTGLDLTLYWQTEQLQETNYSVFTQLLDSSGQLVSGHDGLPVNGSMPTTIWKPNYIIPDAHHIPLPSGQASGTYRLIVGMYDSNGIRLNFMSPGGEAFADQAIPLRSLTWQ
jgi:hypothetical protein